LRFFLLYKTNNSIGEAEGYVLKPLKKEYVTLHKIKGSAPDGVNISTITDFRIEIT